VDLFEYQGKEYLARFGVPIPPGGVADTPDEAAEKAESLGYPVAVKAQVQVGGRGKAGGIRLASDTSEVFAHAEAILGMTIGGHTVRRLWVERALSIAREYYASFTLDRTAKAHLAIVSARGGVDIEEVAASDPGAIARLYIDPLVGFNDTTGLQLAAQAGLETDHVHVSAVLARLYRCFTQGDADLVEVNPLALSTAGAVFALDAKVTLDDNAAFRHPEWVEFGRPVGLDDRELRARELGLQYVGLDGSVGIIANGAGLAMSTCDVVNQVGGKPANFLDIGGGANAEVMAASLEVINSDASVRSIFVNIFGGITRCEEVANGIVAAIDRVGMKVPLVIRLDGTNAREGREIVKRVESEMVISSPSMMGAARLAVELAGGGR